MVYLENKMYFIVDAKYAVIIFIVCDNIVSSPFCHFPGHLYLQCLFSHSALCIIKAIYAHEKKVSVNIAISL